LAVILDVNVFVSAALSANGPSAALVRALRDGDLEVVVSPKLLTEFDDVLRRPKFRRFITLDEVDELVQEIALLCRVEPDPAPGDAVLRDRDDDYLVFLARAIGVDCIVSGDADLTDAQLKPPALTPRQAVERFGFSE
jgi:uncharacterized protein